MYKNTEIQAEEALFVLRGALATTDQSISYCGWRPNMLIANA